MAPARSSGQTIGAQGLPARQLHRLHSDQLACTNTSRISVSGPVRRFSAHAFRTRVCVLGSLYGM